MMQVSELDRPIFKVDPETLFGVAPFFTDYYSVISFRKRGGPIVLNDPHLVEYYSINLEKWILVKMNSFERIVSPTFKYQWTLFLLSDGRLCYYIQKEFIWDVFKSVGVVLLVGADHFSVKDYFAHFFKRRKLRSVGNG